MARQAGDFVGRSVVIIPYPALGDLTVYLRLGWLFHRAGAQVTFCCNVLLPTQDYFPWVNLLPEDECDLAVLAGRFDLVISCFEMFSRMKVSLTTVAELHNVAFVSAKKIARESGLNGRGVIVCQHCFPNATRAFCLDSQAGKTMVEWVDSYAHEVFGLKLDTMDGMLQQIAATSAGNLVLVFPTTPQAKKNYWLSGFRVLARTLQRRGWQVEFVCMPAEHERIQSALPGFQVSSFPDLRALMGRVASAAVVISNDSGGGHLASLLGVATFTITRRRENFVWRPGFSNNNTVLYPWFRFKWLDKQYVWRPFVPVWRIAAQLGQRKPE
ncbi:glycosyltransferase family 9 protein [Pseudomonas sp. NyZ704]|nr:glycosyltransferase family 9 protein [Pseudomonas sp. NyZ704]